MSHRVKVDPIACTAHGMCAELLPERVTLDEWGYPIIDDAPVAGEVLDHARRAAQACPTFALLLTRDETRRLARTSRGGGGGGSERQRLRPRAPNA